ncbi:hypothetical protein HYDPIDRAFT_172597 [Hydnomerulius pinastri MD-312]|nr:hypothetical protein HYDPIDRAFT_172597 [Hydnomerulius pinastri MD-312]
MQAQAPATNNEVQTLTSTSSLQCVETLLKAGLGCIAYLRGLLPYENFSEYHLSAQTNNALSTQPSGSFSSDAQSRQTISGMAIMNLKRGFTNEGDRILDYLEKGIFEAIEKQYLRRFIFAIYLDNKDPNNIVEAYTFNFQYHKVPGTNTVVPIMSLGDQLSKMSLCRTGCDPMADALKRGKLPTLGEVKRSLKSTPDDYQPPYFRAGDTESNRWFFTTHRTGEIPESTTVGNLETGWHGVNMKVVSVSSYLPSSTEDNNAMFTGITAHSAPKLTPVEEARLRSEDAELQKTDALDRNVVWDADEDEDAQGEDVSDDGIVLTRYNGEVSMVPIGIRGDDGKLLPIPYHEPDNASTGPAQYDGLSETTPTRVGHLITSGGMEETQVIPATQEIDMRSPSPVSSLHHIPSLPPSDICGFTESAISTQQVDTLALKKKLRQRERSQVTSDSEMLDMETQVPPGQELPRRATIKHSHGQARSTLSTVKTRSSVRMAGVAPDEGCSFYGATDKRLPSQFICLDCRLRMSRQWDIIAGKIHADMISRFKDLALFRRAIKIFEVHRPNTAQQFREQIGCPAALVGQLLTRLEDEGFIATEGAISDDLGSTRGQSKKGKKHAKGKGKKTQKELKTTRYIFLHMSKRSKAYFDYFSPVPEVENRLMGLSNTGGLGVLSDTLDLDSQTQEPTQNVLTLAVLRQAGVNLKRKAGSDANGTIKKLKVSIGSGVDLCD